MKKLVVIVVALCLQGCAGAFVNYVEPTSGPTATLTTNMDAVTFSGIYASEKCDRLPEGVFFGYPPYPTIRGNPDYKITKKIPAKNGIVVAFHAQVIGYPNIENCGISVKFNAEPGATYEAVSRYTANKCYANVFKVISPTEKVEEKSAQTTKKVCGLL